MVRVARALSLADRLMAGEPIAAPARASFRRSVALGDPQAAAAKLFALLEHHRLLGDDGWLAPDVQLVSIGDHFDFGTRATGTLDEARVDGPRFLRWLAAHGREQVTILLGNHDAARVQELAFATDERFAAAAGPAAELIALRDGDRAAYDARLGEYAAAFPELPGPGLVHRDFSAFTEAQRGLVVELLLAGRLRLAASASADGAAVLCTHAGVTSRELEQLGVADEREAPALAAALEGHLRAAIARVAPAWRAGQRAALSLAPLHVAGATGNDGDPALPEGGGLLYHRPADPARPGGDPTWELEHTRPRRFHPRTLPRGVVQAVGHTGHAKCVAELIRWREPGMVEAPAGLRTLRVRGDDVEYRLGAAAPAADDAVVYMIDPSLHRVADVATVALLELDPGSIR